jgi:hypothetical protein
VGSVTVVVFEGAIELGEEVIVGAKGDGGPRDSCLSVGGSPG